MQPIAESAPQGVCVFSDFEACTEACSSRECLDWCAGSACVAVARELHTCAAPGEERWLERNPEPELVYLPPGPDMPDDEAYADVDPDSEEQLTRWEDERDQALVGHWQDACATKCENSFDTSEGQRAACERFEIVAYDWKAFAKLPEPPPEPAKKRPKKGAKKYALKGPNSAQAEMDRQIAENAGVLGALSDAGAMSGMFGVGALGGSTLRVRRDSLGEFNHTYALQRLITRSTSLEGADTCISNLGDEPESIELTVRFDAEGNAEIDVSGEPSVSDRAADCVRDLVEQRLTVPPLATRGLPPITVDVRVAKPVDYGNMWGGLVGDEVGEAYGAGGLGLRGTGAGGGGTGEGTIGLGNYGTIGKGGGTGSGYGRGSGTRKPNKKETAKPSGGTGEAPPPAPKP